MSLRCADRLFPTWFYHGNGLFFTSDSRFFITKKKEIPRVQGRRARGIFHAVKLSMADVTFSGYITVKERFSLPSMRRLRRYRRCCRNRKVRSCSRAVPKDPSHGAGSSVRRTPSKHRRHRHRHKAVAGEYADIADNGAVISSASANRIRTCLRAAARRRIRNDNLLTPGERAVRSLSGFCYCFQFPVSFRIFSTSTVSTSSGNA